MSTAVNPNPKKPSVIVSHLRLLAAYFRFNLAAAMEYRGSFLLQVFGMALNNSAFIIFWAIVYSRINHIGEYGFREVMFIWALASAAFGFAHIIFGNIRQVSRIIMQGELDAYLLQPKDVCLNVLCSRTEVSAWGDLAYGLILFMAVWGFAPGEFLLFCTFTVFSGLLMGCIMFSGEILTFFLGNTTVISRLVTEFVISFTLYPESVFRGTVKWLIYSLIPAGFIVFVPLKIFKLFSWQALGLLILIDLGYVFGSYLLFRLGLRRYESGNLIVGKL